MILERKVGSEIHGKTFASAWQLAHAATGPDLEGRGPAIRYRNGERAWFHQSSADEAQEGSNVKACVVAYARDFCPHLGFPIMVNTSARAVPATRWWSAFRKGSPDKHSVESHAIWPRKRPFVSHFGTSVWAGKPASRIGLRALPRFRQALR